MENLYDAHLFKVDNFEYFKNKAHQLIQIEIDIFQIIEYGSFKPILCDGNIIESELANLLFELVPEQIEYYKQITIYRKSTNEVWNNYYAVAFKNNLEINNFAFANNQHLKVYSFMYSSIYISEELKKNIQKRYSKINELDFIKEIPLIG